MESGEIHHDHDGPQTVAHISTADGDMVIQEVSELDEDEPVAKRQRLIEEVEEEIKSTEIDVDAMLQKSRAGDSLPDDFKDQENFRRELEDIKRQAEQFKEQLKQKDKDLEQYKKQLGEITDTIEETS